MRKFGFFLIQAAGLYQELHQHAACTAILQSIQPLYKLHPVMLQRNAVDGETEEEEEDGGEAAAVKAINSRLLSMSAERRQERGITGDQRWLTLQKSLLEHLIYTAHKMNSPQHHITMQH